MRVTTNLRWPRRRGYQSSSINADAAMWRLLGANVSNRRCNHGKTRHRCSCRGDEMTLDVAGDGLLNVTVDKGAVNALVQNGGLISANGGHGDDRPGGGDLLRTVVKQQRCHRGADG